MFFRGCKARNAFAYRFSRRVPAVSNAKNGLQPVLFALRLGGTIMKSFRITLLALWICSALAAYAADATPTPSPTQNPSPTSALKDDKDKISYSLGIDIGRTLQRLELDLNVPALSQGIADVLGNKAKALSDDEVQKTLQAFQQQMMQKQQAAMSKKQAEMKVVAEKNKADGRKFLDEKAKQAGVQKTPSGLEYKVIKEGTGAKPTDTDIVETNYRGTTIDGKEFDSSAKHGSASTLPVNGVIKGWSEALKMMPVGSKWEIYVPSDLAYGDEGYGDDIAPGSTLVFELELLNIKKPVPNPPGATTQPENNTEEKPAAGS
jgi:FKBP-type peptidyl-prolyl cis-trans isomerase FklB